MVCKGKRRLQRCREIVGRSNADMEEGAGAEASRLAEQHGQPGVDVPQSRTVEGGEGAV
ncbi:hypothetical protein GJ744_008642 [Endocarpon pusillum]|uniref:Uncharacterized protein n=1 Tax=Endocarpon pusillum TaxID=364733 RepID=A0A8H7E4Z6_9EURO|nr:hypothetical protein GJ744_008642 [Endocarpon pusillum]